MGQNEKRKATNLNQVKTGVQTTAPVLESREHDDAPDTTYVELDYSSLDADERYMLDCDVKAGVDHLNGEVRTLRGACYGARAINPNFALHSATKVRAQAEKIIKRLTMRSAFIVLLGLLMLSGCCDSDSQRAHVDTDSRPACQDGHCNFK